MKKVLNAENPFGLDRYGFLWETLFLLNKKGRHLDYGTNDGTTLKKLSMSGVIKEGVGVDLNISAINSANVTQENISLIAIKKGARLPFEDNSFDTISILDVIEHIYDQKSVLLELNRLLKTNGKIIITVPRKHIFSFLDLGNYKFIFPRLHKIMYQLKNSKELYHKRYIKCENGLFGDIEKEKMWHQHFSNKELSTLLKECGFTPIDFDGSGLFVRPLSLFSILFPFTKPIICKIRAMDCKMFAHAHLFCLAKKQ